MKALTSPLFAIPLICGLLHGHQASAQTTTFYTDCLCPVKIVPWYSTSCLLIPSGPGFPIVMDNTTSPQLITPPTGKVLYQLDFYFPASAATPLYSWNCAYLGLFNQTSPSTYCDENGYSIRLNTQGKPPTFRLTCF